jgi:hypothetical protein
MLALHSDAITQTHTHVLYNTLYIKIEGEPESVEVFTWHTVGVTMLAHVRV